MGSGGTFRYPLVSLLTLGWVVDDVEDPLGTDPEEPGDLTVRCVGVLILTLADRVCHADTLVSFLLGQELTRSLRRTREFGLDGYL